MPPPRKEAKKIKKPIKYGTQAPDPPGIPYVPIVRPCNRCGDKDPKKWRIIAGGDKFFCEACWEHVKHGYPLPRIDEDKPL